MGRGAWWATVHGVPKSRMWLSDWAQTINTFVVWATVSYNLQLNASLTDRMCMPNSISLHGSNFIQWLHYLEAEMDQKGCLSTKTSITVSTPSTLLLGKLSVPSLMAFLLLLFIHNNKLSPLFCGCTTCIWDLFLVPWPEIKPMPPVGKDRLLTIGPPGKSPWQTFPGHVPRP